MRLRRIPDVNNLSIQIKRGEQTSRAMKVSLKPASLTIASICFSNNIDRIYLYARDRTGEDFILKEIHIDGNRAESASTGTLASCAGFLPVEIPIGKSLEHRSLHHIAVMDKKGRTAEDVDSLICRNGGEP